MMRSKFILPLLMVIHLTSFMNTTISSVGAEPSPFPEPGPQESRGHSVGFYSVGYVLLAMTIGYAIFHYVAFIYRMAVELCRNRQKEAFQLVGNEDFGANTPAEQETSFSVLDSSCSTQAFLEDPSDKQDKFHEENEKVRKVRKPLPPIRGMFQGPLPDFD